MERLTVSEAAERLGISKEAVRKRVQRGTLAHGKQRSGSVYVYMDADKDANGDISIEKSNAASQTRQRSRWDYVAGVSGLFVLMGGLIYVLGLFALWVPIARTYTHDLTTSWQAVSLVPKTVVAGLGMKQLLAFPLLLMAAAFTLVWLLDRLLRLPGYIRDKLGGTSANTGEHSEENSEETGLRIGAVICFAWALIILYIGWLIIINLPQTSDDLGQYLMVLAGVYALVGLVLAFPIVFGRHLFARLRNTEDAAPKEATQHTEVRNEDKRPLISRVKALRARFEPIEYPLIVAVVGLIIMWLIVQSVWGTSNIWHVFQSVAHWFREVSDVRAYSGVDSLILFIVMVVACAGIFFAALPLVRGSDGRVSWEIIRIFISLALVCSFVIAFLLTLLTTSPLPSVEIDSDVDYKGDLLVHNERFWYVFDREGELIAIPDEEVKTVRILSEDT